jgi:hypothetical protein
MRALVLVIACLSMLLLASRMPGFSPSMPTFAVSPSLSPTPEGVKAKFVATSVLLGDRAPTPGAAALLCLGLAGLTVVGGRRYDRSRGTAVREPENLPDEERDGLQRLRA